MTNNPYFNDIIKIIVDDGVTLILYGNSIIKRPIYGLYFDYIFFHKTRYINSRRYGIRIVKRET